MKMKTTWHHFRSRQYTDNTGPPLGTIWRPLGTYWGLHLDTFWEVHGQHLSTIWNNLETTLRQLWGDFETTLGQPWGKFEKTLRQLWQNFDTNLKEHWEKFKSSLRQHTGCFFYCSALKMTKCQTHWKIWHLELFWWDLQCNLTLSHFLGRNSKKNHPVCIWYEM